MCIQCNIVYIYIHSEWRSEACQRLRLVDPLSHWLFKII